MLQTHMLARLVHATPLLFISLASCVRILEVIMVFLLSQPGTSVGRAFSSPDTATGLAAHFCSVLKLRMCWCLLRRSHRQHGKARNTCFCAWPLTRRLADTTMLSQQSLAFAQGAALCKASLQSIVDGPQRWQSRHVRRDSQKDRWEVPWCCKCRSFFHVS